MSKVLCKLFTSYQTTHTCAVPVIMSTFNISQGPLAGV